VQREEGAMSVAKFVAANGREALRQVREAMGPDAVVLSNRTVEGGVEIVAMRDADLGAISGSARPYVPPVEERADDAALGDLRGELKSMRALMERQFAGMGSTPVAAGDPLRESLFAWLAGAGFSGQLARTLLAHLPLGHDRPAAMAWIRQELARKVQVLGDDDALFAQGGVLALIGPTGVGKTTTTAKLAARFVLKHGPERLALLTTDSFRIGAHEQLRIYGDILGVPVHAVKDAADLRFALDALADKHLVIVDTVGMSQRDRNLSEQIAMLAGVQAPVQRVLLLNGASHGDTLNEVVHAYRQETAAGGQGSGGLDGCIISKLDEATHLGAVLDVVIRHRLPVFYASTGQRVPEHLELAQSQALVERAFLTPRRGSVFADADVAHRLGGAAEESDAASAPAADDMLRSLSDSADAVGTCVAELEAGAQGFGLLRGLWRQREDREDDMAPLRAVAQQVRESACREVGRRCERYVLALGASASVQAPGRRAPQSVQYALWLADRDGYPLAATVTGGRGGAGEAEASTLRAALAAARTVVNVVDALPGPAVLARWQQGGERWLAGARKGSRVLSGGAAWKIESLAETLTFHAMGDVSVQGREAVQWLAQVPVRVPEGPLQRRAGRSGAEGGIEACLLVSRLVARDSGKSLETAYLLCDPELAGETGQLARWARWGQVADARFRTLRHALDHLARGAVPSADEAQCRTALLALQAGLTALRLEHEPTASAPAFLARLAGRVAGKGAQSGQGPLLVEGLARLLALLDVLENYPLRTERKAAQEATPQAAPFATAQADALAAQESAGRYAAVQLAPLGE